MFIDGAISNIPRTTKVMTVEVIDKCLSGPFTSKSAYPLPTFTSFLIERRVPATRIAAGRVGACSACPHHPLHWGYPPWRSVQDRSCPLLRPAVGRDDPFGQ